MKIDLTREEWEFLKYILPEIQRFQNIETSKFLKKLHEKLGSEWVDDE